MKGGKHKPTAGDAQTYKGRHTNRQIETHKSTRGYTQTCRGRHTNLKKKKKKNDKQTYKG